MPLLDVAPGVVNTEMLMYFLREYDRYIQALAADAQPMSVDEFHDTLFQQFVLRKFATDLIRATPGRISENEAELENRISNLRAMQKAVRTMDKQATRGLSAFARG